MSRRGDLDFWQEVRDRLAPADGDTSAGRFREWSTRDNDAVRTHLERAGRYSRFVEVMKFALPLAAFAILVMVILASVLARQSSGLSIVFESLPSLENDLYMINPKITGFDARNRPYVVTAERAVQDKTNKDLVLLDTIAGQLMSPDEAGKDPSTLVALSAHKGELNKESQRLIVRGDVVIIGRSDYRLDTEEAQIDFDGQRITSNAGVKALGPKGRITSDGMTVLDDGNTVVFRGHVTTLITPKPSTDQNAAEGTAATGGGTTSERHEN